MFLPTQVLLKTQDNTNREYGLHHLMDRLTRTRVIPVVLFLSAICYQNCMSSLFFVIVYPSMYRCLTVPILIEHTYSM